MNHYLDPDELYMALERTWDDLDVRADLATLRQHQPLVHCLTNIVVTGFTANVLLAIGASPAMVIAEEESSVFAGIAASLLVNVGTVTATDQRAMHLAAAAAHDAGTPWVLDPVAVGFLVFRTRIATELLQHRPAVIRGNASEILALTGASGGGKGVDSTASSSDAVEPARELAVRTGAVVAVSGATDYITNGSETVAVPGGHPIMTRVTGTGCSLGAVIAAFLGAKISPLRAATAASAVFARAGERAATAARGPGSFAVAFIDELALIGSEQGLA
jgi:hydroxyethylthiazole kinase